LFKKINGKECLPEKVKILNVLSDLEVAYPNRFILKAAQKYLEAENYTGATEILKSLILES
jgi:hypothetical protein